MDAGLTSMPPILKTCRLRHWMPVLLGCRLFLFGCRFSWFFGRPALDFSNFCNLYFLFH